MMNLCTKIGFFIGIFLFVVNIASGQSCNNSTQHPFLPVPVTTTPGTSTTISFSINAGKYSVVTGFVPGATYLFTSTFSGNPDYITLRRTDNNAIVAEGVSGVFYTVEVGITSLEVHVNLNNGSCGSDLSPHTSIVAYQIGNPGCPDPTGLNSSAITTTTAVLNWTETGSSMAWDIELVLAGTSPTGTITYDNIIKPYTAIGLNPTTSYEYYVRADCAMNNTSVSSWVGPHFFTTLTPPCDYPEGTATYDCNADGITVNITNTGLPVGNYTATIDGAGTGQAITATGDYTFTGLTPDQTYNVVLDDGFGCFVTIPSVYGDCFSLDVGCVSMWPAGDFESGDSNWNENGAVGGGAGVNVANTLIVPTMPLAGVKSARFGGFGGTNPVSAVPPFTSTLVESFFGATGSTYTLRFWILVDACDSASDLFEISVDGTVEYSLTGGDVTCGDEKWREITLDLSPYADNTVHTVNFQLVENETNGGATSLFIDEMVMEECTPITCPASYLIPTTVNPGTPAYNGGFVSAGLWDFETDGTIVSIQKITTGNTVDYDSQTSIELGALNGNIFGFEVELGATFHAFIDGCNGTGGTVNPLSEEEQPASLAREADKAGVVKEEKRIEKE